MGVGPIIRGASFGKSFPGATSFTGATAAKAHAGLSKLTLREECEGMAVKHKGEGYPLNFLRRISLWPIA